MRGDEYERARHGKRQPRLRDEDEDMRIAWSGRKRNKPQRGGVREWNPTEDQNAEEAR